MMVVVKLTLRERNLTLQLRGNKERLELDLEEPKNRQLDVFPGCRPLEVPPLPCLSGSEAPEAEQRILGGETVVTKWRVTNAGDG